MATVTRQKPMTPGDMFKHSDAGYGMFLGWVPKDGEVQAQFQMFSGPNVFLTTAQSESFGILADEVFNNEQ